MNINPRSGQESDALDISGSSRGKGLVIVGAMPRCGKTAACAGITGMLLNTGFKVHALKPLVFTQGMSLPVSTASETSVGHHVAEYHPAAVVGAPVVQAFPGSDQQFLDRIARTLQPSETIETESPHTLSSLLWNRMLENCRRLPYPLLLESVGTVATPLRFQPDERHGSAIIDAVDLARMLEMPLLLVASKSHDLIGQMAPAFTYLWNRDAKLLGWLVVGTDPATAHVPDWESQALLLSREYQVSCLGEIAYRPSVDIVHQQQGNLIRQSEVGLDLFPIQQSLQLSLI